MTLSFLRALCLPFPIIAILVIGPMTKIAMIGNVKKETTMETEDQAEARITAFFADVMTDIEKPDPEQDAFNEKRRKEIAEQGHTGHMCEYYDVA